jgi:hypothetical protein
MQSRGLLPFEAYQEKSSGWGDYSIHDVVKIMVMLILSRQSTMESASCLVRDNYEKILRMMRERKGRESLDLFMGTSTDFFIMDDGDEIYAEGFENVFVGTHDEFAEQAGLGPDCPGLILLVNVSACARLAFERAKRAGMPPKAVRALRKQWELAT